MNGQNLGNGAHSTVKNVFGAILASTRPFQGGKCEEFPHWRRDKHRACSSSQTNALMRKKWGRFNSVTRSGSCHPVQIFEFTRVYIDAAEVEIHLKNYDTTIFPNHGTRADTSRDKNISQYHCETLRLPKCLLASCKLLKLVF